MDTIYKKYNYDSFYLSKSLKFKEIYLVIAFFFDAVICFTSLFILPLTLIDYSSAAFGYFLFMTIGFGFLLYLRVKSIFFLCAAKEFSEYMLKANEPFITISNLPDIKLPNGLNISKYGNKRKIKNLDFLDGALREGYLRNCTIEIHSGVPKLVLSKKVIKDKCHTCGGPITEIENEICVCAYCGNQIKRVLEKKV